MEKILKLEDIIAQLGIKEEHFEKWRESNFESARIEGIVPAEHYVTAFNMTVEPIY